MIRKAYVSGRRPPRNLFYNEMTVHIQDFDSEEELFRHIFRSCGPGDYFINIRHKPAKGFSKPLWKGSIKDKDPFLVIEANEYRNMDSALGMEALDWGSEGYLKLKKRNADPMTIKY